MTARPDQALLWTSGFDRADTGIGVIQRRLAPSLERLGWSLVRGPDRPDHGPDRLRFKLRQALAPVPDHGAAALLTMTPGPIRNRLPTVAVIYDLRWQRTANSAKRRYRSMELSRTIRQADEILVISNRTRDDLLKSHPETREVATVLPLGPGQFDGFLDPVPPKQTGTVLLVGGAPHKRNELAAEALCIARPPWATRIIGVGLSAAAEASVVAMGGSATSEFHHRVPSQEMQQLFCRSETFISLSVEEGFGFPYIEALAAGCRVIAIDQSLTRELLQSSAILISDGEVLQIAAQLGHLQAPSHPAPAPTHTFSWESTAEVADAALRRAIAKRAPK